MNISIPKFHYLLSWTVNKLKFKIGNTKIEISFLFTALISIMIFFDNTGLLGYFFAVAGIHEAAHLSVMWALRSAPDKIKLVPGGIFIIDKSLNTFLEDSLILIAGPLSNLICFLVFKGDFSLISLLLFIYNSLPVKGLDGGSLVFIIVNRLVNLRVADITLNILTVSVALLFGMAFIALLFNGIQNYSLLIFFLYLISAVFLKKGVETNG